MSSLYHYWPKYVETGRVYRKKKEGDRKLDTGNSLSCKMSPSVVILSLWTNISVPNSLKPPPTPVRLWILKQL